MQKIESILLDLQERIVRLEKRAGPADSKAFEPTSVDQVSSSSQRIPISGETYYLDFDGSARVKNVQISVGDTIFRFALNSNELWLELSTDGGSTWDRKSRWF